MSSLGKFILLVLLVLVSVVIFRAQFMFKSRQPPRPYTIETDNRKIKLLKTHEILDRFEGALNIPSVSYKQHQYESKQMLRLIKFIKESKSNVDYIFIKLIESNWLHFIKTTITFIIRRLPHMNWSQIIAFCISSRAQMQS